LKTVFFKKEKQVSLKTLNTILLTKAKNHSRTQSYTCSVSSALTPQNKCDTNDC